MTVETVVFPDVEAIVVAHLKQELAARGDTAAVSTGIPSSRPPRLVRIRRTGGAQRDAVTDLPQMLVECWDTRSDLASGLGRLVRSLIQSLPWDATHGGRVRHVFEMGGLTYYPDPLSDSPRYQFLVQLNVRGDALEA